MWRLVLTLVNIGALSLITAHAHAIETRENRPISAAGLIAYGAGLSGLNAWDLGLGVRGGYNLERIYLGARFTYHFGSIAEDEFGDETDELRIWELAVEGGYEFNLLPKLTLRPEVGLGLAHRTGNLSSSGGYADEGWDEDFEFLYQDGESSSDSATKPFVAIGAALLYDVSPSFFLGLDAQLHAILGDGNRTAIVAALSAGLRFGT